MWQVQLNGGKGVEMLKNRVIFVFACLAITGLIPFVFAQPPERESQATELQRAAVFITNLAGQEFSPSVNGNPPQ